MQIRQIRYSSYFLRKIKKIPFIVKIDLAKTEENFRENPFHARLKTHKLSGKLSNLWSFSVNYQVRILFKFDTQYSVTFLDIGSHDIYKEK